MNEIMAGYNKQFGNEPDEMTKIKNQIHLFLDEEINDDEIDFMIKYCDENGEDVQSNIQNYGIHFLEMIRTQKKQLHENEQNNHNISEQYDDESNSDEEYVPMQVQKSKKRKKKKRVKARSKQSNESELSMDEWLASLSSIQRKSFKERTKSDNAFFYRFNASHIDSDDKIQRDLINLAENKKGTWSKSEHQIFMKQVLKIVVNISWGIFSKDIAGRVGYVCSNYWRALIKNGDVKDLNYVQSTNNEKKLSFIKKSPLNFKRFAVTIINDKSKTFTNLPSKHPKHPSDEVCEQLCDAMNNQEVHAKNIKKRKNKKCEIMSDNDEIFECNHNEIEMKAENPMPSFIDVMTGNVVIEPAISPYGHVLGYQSWTTILRKDTHKNQCPFTKKKMTRRSLIKLTVDNIEKYKKNIVNLSDEQAQFINL